MVTTLFRFTIRKAIITLTTTLLVIIGVVITYIAYVGSKQSIYTLAENMLGEISSHVVHQTTDFIEPANKISKLTYHLVNNDILSVENTRQLLEYFQDVLLANNQFVMMYFGDVSGNVYMAKRMPDNSFSLRTVTRQTDNVVTEWHHQNPEYNKLFPNTVEPIATGYDPRKRPWYIEAVKANRAVWTGVYIFSTDKKPGVSNAVAIYDKSGHLKGVMSIDIGITELSYFLATLKVGKRGRAFILNQDRKIIALPIKEESEINQLYQTTNASGKEVLELQSIENIKDTVVYESFKIFTASGKTLDKKGGQYYFFPCQYQGEDYLVMYKSSLLGDNFWFIGVVLPERDIMYMVYQNNRIMMITSAILVIIAIALGALLSRVIANPLMLLSREMVKIKNFELEATTAFNSPLSEVANMINSFDSMRKGLRSFQKYVPSEVVRELIKMDKEATLGGERRELTIFFSDIANFTTVAETLDPEKLVESLAIYFSRVSSVIIEHQGTVDKYIGDAVMAFWGAPKALENHATLACYASLQIQRMLTVLLHRLQRENKISFPTRIGLNTGEVVVGNMGSEQRLNYTVLGDSVNLASRVEGLNKFYNTQILLTENTYALAKQDIECRWLDFVAVKGKTQGVAIYELIAEKDNLSPQSLDLLRLHEEAAYWYRERQWAKARQIFQAVCNFGTTCDMPSKILLERCEKFTMDPPPTDWSGIMTFHNK